MNKVMKVKMMLILVGICLTIHMPKGYSQSTEIAQLLLNVAKWEALQENLKTLKKGYEVLTKGYKAVKDISEGNFNLHDAFLGNLWQVSPTVKNYKKVSEIIQTEIRIIKEYKSGFQQCLKSGQFSANELDYLERVFKRVTDESVENLDELLMIITARQMRMNDEDRLNAIDAISVDMESKLSFVRRFNASNQTLLFQRIKQHSDLELQKRLEGFPE
ncbi:TerB family tellurite resistance protein [Chitinophaga rhizophila]|uniref:TerB family tellurite resistance protein n=1 Tax=Chitinophaga rhizophila TaxID=2866212 RepID=A0ABS7G7S5_9BACT|nr:TerB family tellurite resistance protein [Chitinophaga rhizophila]MBW8683446.1 TerB family tellurite resistance protein [Chitinophaga rhizophila]